MGDAMRWMIVFAVVMLSGCAAFQNVNVSDLRSDKHRVADGSIPLTIPQIQQAVYDYREKCRDIGKVAVNPSNPSAASFVTYTMGASSDSAILLIDLQQKGSLTDYQGYLYYNTWKRQLDHDIQVMSGSATCD